MSFHTCYHFHARARLHSIRAHLLLVCIRNLSHQTNWARSKPSARVGGCVLRLHCSNAPCISGNEIVNLSLAGQPAVVAFAVINHIMHCRSGHHAASGASLILHP